MKIRFLVFAAAWLAILVINLAGTAIKFAWEVGVEMAIMTALAFFVFRISDLFPQPKVRKPKPWDGLWRESTTTIEPGKATPDTPARRRSF